VLEIEKPIVIGYSFGGIVAMFYATRYPKHPAKLILNSTSAQLVGERSFSMFEKLGGGPARAAAVNFWTNPGKQAVKDYNDLCLPLYTQPKLPSGFYSRAVRNPEMSQVFIEDELKSAAMMERLLRIECPTLVLAGEEDPITLAADAEGIAAALPPGLCHFHCFENSGHHLFLGCTRIFLRDSAEIHHHVTNAST